MPRQDWVSIALSLFETMKKEIESSGQLTADLMKSLHFLHGKTLLPALDLVDSNKVKVKRSPSSRWVYHVVGSSGTPYTCLPTSNYCSCPAFRFNVVLKKEAIMCKHVLATRLASALKQAEEEEVTDDYIKDALATLD